VQTSTQDERVRDIEIDREAHLVLRDVEAQMTRSRLITRSNHALAGGRRCFTAACEGCCGVADRRWVRSRPWQRVERHVNTRVPIAAAVALGRAPVNQGQHRAVPDAAGCGACDEAHLDKRVAAEHRPRVRGRRGAQRQLSKRLRVEVELLCKRTPFPLSFSCVCPEPALVN
jgi:hypothetical protein